ncbi:hypothetical protein B0H67DRAFT_558369 [Lasiosphaeris hirsuta]|uniref:Uncharacterized protein n=1 Tax=Lasiosphaeris hirsuta TaxID=260670 RepID=A0AA40DIN0_9PEZI|nr:hypothetical protein B0H67DRAFT_558369 [Lasiosphaeris hirsuta]
MAALQWCGSKAHNLQLGKYCPQNAKRRPSTGTSGISGRPRYSGSTTPSRETLIGTLSSPFDLDRAAALPPEFKYKAKPNEDAWPKVWGTKGSSLQGVLSRPEWRKGRSPPDSGTALATGASTSGNKRPRGTQAPSSAPAQHGRVAKVEDAIYNEDGFLICSDSEEQSHRNDKGKAVI